MTSDIVKLFYSIPNFTLYDGYKPTFVEKVNKKFNNDETRDFFIHFHHYLYKDPFSDFIIDLDNVWEYTGVKQKITLKRALEKHYTLDKDYKILENPIVYNKKEKRGGHNKKTIMINIVTFHSLCIKRFTKRGDDTYDKFNDLENFIKECIIEDMNEMKKELQLKKELLSSYSELVVN